MWEAAPHTSVAVAVDRSTGAGGMQVADTKVVRKPADYRVADSDTRAVLAGAAVYIEAEVSPAVRAAPEYVSGSAEGEAAASVPVRVAEELPS